MDYPKKFLEQEQEIEFLKQDIQCLRSKIEAVTRENYDLKIDLELLKTEEMKYKSFSEDGLKAVSELLEILNESEAYSFNEHKFPSSGSPKWFYKIYNIDGLPIFVLQNYSKGGFRHLPCSVHPGLLTTPENKDINNDYKDIYKCVTSSWYLFANHSPRKQYDIRGKSVLEVMDILDQFR
jgi:hypothetical protein